MAQRTIARMYDSYQSAQTVVNELEAAGIPHGDISLVANAEAHGTSSATPGSVAADPAAPVSSTGHAETGAAGGTGALLGTALGGGVGLLAGIGALAIPGVGPVVAAGWLIATLTGAGLGAASGGLLGSLTGAGLSHDEANVYAEGVRGGGSLVTVRADETEAARVEGVMDRHGPVDWQQRRASYGSDWKGFDETSTSKVRVYPAVPEAGVATGSDIPAAGGSYTSATDPTRRL